MPMNPTHISEFAAKTQWAAGGLTGFGGGVMTFLTDNYYAFGVIGILGGLAIGAHGGYWLYQISKIKRDTAALERRLKQMEVDRKEAELGR